MAAMVFCRANAWIAGASSGNSLATSGSPCSKHANRWRRMEASSATLGTPSSWCCKGGWHLIAASWSVAIPLAFALQHQPNQALGCFKGCGCQHGAHPDSGVKLWSETRTNSYTNG